MSWGRKAVLNGHHIFFSYGFIRIIYCFLISTHTYDVNKVLLSYGWLTNSSAWHGYIVAMSYKWLLIHPYDIRVVRIYCGRLIILWVWHKWRCHFIRRTYDLIRMTELQMSSHTDDLLCHPHYINSNDISYSWLINPYDRVTVAIAYARLTNTHTHIHTYIPAITISYGWLINSSLWHSNYHYLIRMPKYLIRMKSIPVVSHTDDSSIWHSYYYYLLQTTNEFSRMT